MRRQSRRFRLARDGYLILHGEDRGNLSVQELVSSTGRECELLRGVMDAIGAGQANWRVPAADAERLARVLPAAAAWNWTTDWCYRIVDLSGLLRAYSGLLSARAAALRDGEFTLTVHEHDRRDRATLRIEGGRLEAAASGRAAKVSVDLTPTQAVRLVFGGPAACDPAARTGALPTLFPLPIHVPSFDHV